MGQSNCFLSMLKSISVSMELWKKSAYLHMSFTLILDLLEFICQRNVCWKAIFYVDNTSFNIQSTLIQSSNFLIAHCHVVKQSQVQEFILCSVLNFHLIEDCLCFLQQNKRFVILFPRDVIKSWVIQLMKYYWDLILSQMTYFLQDQVLWKSICQRIHLKICFQTQPPCRLSSFCFFHLVAYLFC